jgi:23S rRNA pseudouridine2604 synthase
LGGAGEGGAGEGNRTLVSCLGSNSSAIELHPRQRNFILSLRRSGALRYSRRLCVNAHYVRDTAFSRHTMTTTEPIRISKILAQRGIASRTEADRMIERGWVSVDGRVAIPGDRALPDAEIVLSAAAKAQLSDAFTIILNKPRGFVSSPDETGGARAMGLLVADNFCGLGQPPSIATFGLRVAGRLSVLEAGLVVFTTDTALARRLAAAEVDESWRIDFAEPQPAAIADAIVAELAGLDQRATPTHVAENSITLTTSSLIKGQLTAACDALGLRATITRLRRGEIALGSDVPEAQWRVL